MTYTNLRMSKSIFQIACRKYELRAEMRKKVYWKVLCDHRAESLRKKKLVSIMVCHLAKQLTYHMLRRWHR